jgi:hypothetical protein
MEYDKNFLMCSRPPGISMLGGFFKKRKTNEQKQQLNSLSWTEQFQRKHGRQNA